MTRTAQVQTQTKNLRSNDYRVVLATDNEQAFLSCHGNALSSGYHLPCPFNTSHTSEEPTPFTTRCEQ